MNKEPIWVGWAVTVIIAAAARYGLQLDDAQAGGIALALGTVVQFVVRRFVTPTVRPRAADGTPLLKANLAGPPPTTYQPPPPRGPSRPLE